MMKVAIWLMIITRMLGAKVHQMNTRPVTCGITHLMIRVVFGRKVGMHIGSLEGTKEINEINHYQATMMWKIG